MFEYPMPPAEPSPTPHTPSSDIYDDREPELIEAAVLYATDPLGFVRQTFQWEYAGKRVSHEPGLLAWQEDILAEIGEHLRHDDRICRVAIASGKGAGKTSLLSMLFLWHVACHQYSQSIITSVTGRQSSDRVWREAQLWFSWWKYRHYFKVQSFRLAHRFIPTWFGLHQTWSQENPEGFQGAHAEYLGFFVDEASGIPDLILRTIESGLTDDHVFLAYTSNPTRTKGMFRECFRAPRNQLFLTRNIDTRACLTVNQDRIAEELARCHNDEDASDFRMFVRGQFPLADYDCMIPEDLVESAIDRPTAIDEYVPIIIGVDVARLGANYTVITIRQGFRLLGQIVGSRERTVSVADKVMETMDRYARWTHGGKRLPACCVDSDGIGGAVVDYCLAAGYHVYEVHSGLPATDHQHFGNHRVEMWWACRQWLENGGSLPGEWSVLCEQLTSAYILHDHLGRNMLESKDSMRSRGVMSPDEADSLVYTFHLEQIEPTTPWMAGMPLR